MVISGVMATMATTPKASVMMLPPMASQAPMAKGSRKVAVIGPRAGQKYIAKGEGFIPREGDTDDVDLNTEGLPNPFLLLIPMGIVVLLLNLIHWPAWAALFIGCVVLALMFWKRYEGFHKIVNTMAEGAKNSQSVIQTAAICGLASVVGAVPGYNLLLGLLEKASFGSPYIMLFVCIAVIAGFTGSATADEGPEGRPEVIPLPRQNTQSEQTAPPPA